MERAFAVAQDCALVFSWLFLPGRINACLIPWIDRGNCEGLNSLPMRRCPFLRPALFVCGIAALSALPALSAELWPQWSVAPVAGLTVKGLPPVDGHFHVDQFGYRPDEKKVAVLSDPQRGFNADDHFAPGPALELCRAVDGVAVFKAEPEVFDHGKTDAVSGDRGWWFDFSEVKQPGKYYVFDPKQGVRSHVFAIAPDVYRQVLRAAVRVFYYQRQAIELKVPYADKPWCEGPKFIQDRKARAVWAKDDPSTERDLSGGWLDAGDTNKYPTFLGEVIHPLLYAWSGNPAAFTDDFNIPESGNGLPDLLDEVKWELSWLVKMQDKDGGVFIKMGMTAERATWPESQDRHPRYYGPKCSASTITAAGIFAHAARVYGRFEPWKPFADDLRSRAERAWRWYRSHPRSLDCDSGEIRSGDGNLDSDAQDRAEAVAAMHLWALTGDASYHDVFKAKVGAMRQLAEPVWTYREMGAAEVLFDYLAQPGANHATCENIAAAYSRSLRLPLFMPQDGANELYRAWMPDDSYHWGGNRTRACHGLAALGGVSSGLAAGAQREQLRQRAADLLHALHGVNPLDFVYLTNMSRYGAESSASRMYHEAYNTELPPGYLVGGPNRDYTGSLDWIRQQPFAKAYAELNEGPPVNSWEITEPAIYYQAIYVRLLSAFVAGASGEGPKRSGGQK